MCRAGVFISVRGDIGPIGLITHNQKVLTRIHMCDKFPDTGCVSRVSNVYWKKLLTFFANANYANCALLVYGAFKKYVA